MSRFGSRARTWGLLPMFGCAIAGSLSGQTTPPRLYVWSETLGVPEGEQILAPSAVAAAGADELLVADGLAKPRLLLFGKQGVSWQLKRTGSVSAVVESLTFDGERWVGALRGGIGLMAFDRTDLAARKVPVPSGLIAGAVDASPGGNLLVYDRAEQRVVELSPSGQTIREVSVPGHVTGLATDWIGGFFITLADEAKVIRFDRDWRSTESWSLPSEDEKPAWPVAIRLDEGGRVTVLDRHAGRILEFDAAGRWVGLGSRRGWEPGLLFLPSSLVQLPSGAVVVADEGNGRVQIFRRIEAGN